MFSVLFNKGSKYKDFLFLQLFSSCTAATVVREERTTDRRFPIQTDFFTKTKNGSRSKTTQSSTILAPSCNSELK